MARIALAKWPSPRRESFASEKPSRLTETKKYLTEKLRQIVAETGARSTDLEAPESADHLCDKCVSYAACWQEQADLVWAEEHP